MTEEPPRSRRAWKGAERALVRVVHHYGARPEFVVLGGLVPELLCSNSPHPHAGTTDIDVQVNLEIACGTVNTERLERALMNAEFEPDNERVWRWRANGAEGRMLVKFELLADLDDHPSNTTVQFDGCQHLGAANLRGTRFAALDTDVRTLSAKVAEDVRTVEIQVAGLAGFLLAKCAAAHSRRKPKDWYDIAFVLLHNDDGGPQAAAKRVTARFKSAIPELRTAIDDLSANFADSTAQGPTAYAEQMLLDNVNLDEATVIADAILAVNEFCDGLRAAY